MKKLWLSFVVTIVLLFALWVVFELVVIAWAAISAMWPNLDPRAVFSGAWAFTILWILVYVLLPYKEKR